MTVTTTVGDLRRTLRLAAAFAADPDMGNPALAAVYLEAGSGTLTATATNRVTLGHARADAKGDLHGGGILVPVRWVTWIADGLDRQAEQDKVIVDGPGAGGNRLRVDTAATTVTVPTRAGWVDYRRIFTEIPQGTSGPSAPVLINPRVLAVIADVNRIVPTACARWTVVDPLKPIRCEVDDVLVALFMPAKDYQQASEHWPVPVGVREPATELVPA